MKELIIEVLNDMAEESSRKTVLRRQRQQFPPVGKNMKFLRIMFGL